jgi:hypothetical protein
MPTTQDIFCFRCRKATPSGHLVPTVMKNGKNAVKGKCTVCEGNTFKIVKKS